MQLVATDLLHSERGVGIFVRKKSGLHELGACFL